MQVCEWKLTTTMDYLTECGCVWVDPDEAMIPNVSCREDMRYCPFCSGCIAEVES